jgi:hypothetical protein
VTGCGDSGSAEQEAAAVSATKSHLSAVARAANENGLAATLNVNGAIDTSSANPFFRSMGENGRTCGSCHVPKENWSITPAGVRQRFDETDGLDPIFRTNDGSNSPTADVSTTKARRSAYSMLLTKGLIRVGIGIPANAEFELVAVDDPYSYASPSELSLFRRPLPTTNLRFLTATMWDGRESTPVPDALRGPNASESDLATQANSATVGHVYDSRFKMSLNAAEKADLTAFLGAL